MISKTSCVSDYANIWVGVHDTESVGVQGDIAPEAALDICERFCTEVGLCVTVTPTTFLYSRGRERGFVARLMNYPRYPDRKKLEKCAMTLGEILLRAFKQCRVSIEFPDVTFMLTDEEKVARIEAQRASGH
jgi:hypothetical protein